MRLSTVDVPERDELVALYEGVGWTAYTADPDALHSAVANSTLIVTARIDGRLVGLARAISDDVSVAFLQDVLVAADHQRDGIGRQLVGQVRRRFEHVRRHVLLTDDEPAQRAFYEAVGFTAAESLDGGPLRTFVADH